MCILCEDLRRNCRALPMSMTAVRSPVDEGADEDEEEGDNDEELGEKKTW